MDKNFKLSPRLHAAASFVRPGARVIDVGTDHAYIPLWLLRNGLVEFSAGSDINEGPLAAAAKNAREWGFGDELKLYLSNGLASCECETNDFDHVIICGMGGELISSIISNSAYASQKGIRFILQPMTMQDKLRIYLSQNGFVITDETIVFDSGKFYQCIVCEYSGAVYSLSPIELLIGQINIKNRRDNPVFYDYAENLLQIFAKKVRGMNLGGHDASYETALLSELSAFLQERTIK